MKRIVFLPIVLLFCGALSWAQNEDYPLQISCSTPGCSTGIGTGTIAGEVNGLTGNTITIRENGNGSPAVIDPVLLIIGVPNASSTFVPPNIVAVNGTPVAAFGPGLTGGAWGWNGSSGGVVFNSSYASAYDPIGLTSGKTGAASESFVNWQTANAQLGLTTTSYTLYVYAIDGTKLSGGNTASITFDTSLPLGTFIIGYSCSVGLTSSPCTMQGDNMGATPFTVAGEMVPEPTTLALLGITGIIGLAGSIRRRFFA